MNHSQEGATPTPLTDAKTPKAVAISAVKEYMAMRHEWEKSGKVAPSYIGIVVLAKIFERHMSGQLARLTAENAELRGRVEEAERDRQRAQDVGNGLFLAIVGRCGPYFPKDTRDLEWDVLPSSLARRLKDLRSLLAEAQEVVTRTAHVLGQKGAVITEQDCRRLLARLSAELGGGAR